MIFHAEFGLILHLFEDPTNVVLSHAKWNKQAPMITNKTAVNNSFYADFELFQKDLGNGAHHCRPRCLSFV